MVAAGLEGYIERGWSPENSSGRGKKELYDMLLGEKQNKAALLQLLGEKSEWNMGNFNRTSYKAASTSIHSVFFEQLVTFRSEGSSHFQ